MSQKICGIFIDVIFFQQRENSVLIQSFDQTLFRILILLKTHQTTYLNVHPQKPY
jgi:hypothetical protein